MESGRGESGEDVSPEALDGVVVVVAELVPVSTVRLDGVDRARRSRQMLAHPGGVRPVLLAFVVVVLRDVNEIVELRMVERAAVFFGFDVPLVPHLGNGDSDAGLAGALLDVLGPVASPGGLAACLVVHAIENVAVAE